MAIYLMFYEAIEGAATVSFVRGVTTRSIILEFEFATPVDIDAMKEQLSTRRNSTLDVTNGLECVPPEVLRSTGRSINKFNMELGLRSWQLSCIIIFLVEHRILLIIMNWTRWAR
ncbi:hypothetical protein M422DRAFT_33585 [Sphaerobolus stellatus SS14]|uniref:Uncharacterized protein n=1 Tax=Sphaerobolus stellatus (strain SS14) TaxID=990650 RepID=A0A0C9US76_SPHS4|nr:hypothetical protein M422DRAFT_33585 [Sphaerobolus stellatus SS14]